jgi:hypothetical protein
MWQATHAGRIHAGADINAAHWHGALVDSSKFTSEIFKSESFSAERYPPVVNAAKFADPWVYYPRGVKRLYVLAKTKPRILARWTVIALGGMLGISESDVIKTVRRIRRRLS